MNVTYGILSPILGVVNPLNCVYIRSPKTFFASRECHGKLFPCVFFNFVSLWENSIERADNKGENHD